ncbi:hypothetical protein N2152v2_006273 [Parachlorella kessleri]
MLQAGQLRSHLLRHSKKVCSAFEGTPAVRALATSSGAGKDSAEVLHNSMSDGFYDVKDRQVAHAEPGAQPQPPRPRNMQEAMSSLSEPNYLMNSLSEGMYEYHPRRRIVPSVVSNSLSDPLPGWLQGFTTAHRGGGTNTQRVVVVSRASITDPEPLHDSFAQGDYTPRKR